MKFSRFICNGEKEIRTGILTGSELKEISGDMFGSWEFTGKVVAEEEVTLVAPLQPNQVIGIGANYVSQPEDLPKTLPDIPVFFFKPVSSVIGSGKEIVIPNKLDEVKFESELAVVIGKKASQVPEADVADVIFGYTVGNDVTAPQYFHEDGHWTIGKSFDTFTPLGPVIETDLNTKTVRVEAYLNGAKKQDSSTDLMIIPIHKMISYLSNVMTLSPGDVILTGSPVGAEFLKDGDVIECQIDGLGTLRNTVVHSNKKVNV